MESLDDMILLAEVAATAALVDAEHLARGVKLAQSERRRLSRALAGMGFPCAPSQTNFLLFDCGRPATEIAEALRRQGVLIKAWMEPPFTNHARVTLGQPAENDLFLDAMSSAARPSGP